MTETGQPLDVKNFTYRIREPALKKAEIKYRYPYQARHTFAMKSIREGRGPIWIANQMGTSLETLFEHYAVYFRKIRSSNHENRARSRQRGTTAS